MKQKRPANTTKGDKTRRRILETASALMAENGPDGVSMREISAKLRITKPVLYYYFKDKDELIRAAFLEGTKHFRELHAEIDKPGLTLERKLELIFSNHLAFIRRYPDMPKCALKIMASPSEGVLASLAGELKQRNRKTLRAMLDRENLPRHGADNVLHMVSSVIAYFMIEARENGATSLGKELPGRLARLICAGARHMKAPLLLLLLAPLAARAQALDLGVDAAVKLAMKNNTSVANAERGRLVYKEKIREYWAGVYPQLSAGAQYTRNLERASVFFGGTKIPLGSDNVYTASLDLNQVLWSGGKVRAGLRMAGLYAASSEERLRGAQNSVKKSVAQLYYSVLLSRAMTDIQQETLALSKQHLATIEARYAQGLASDLAVLRQKVEVSNNEPAVTQNRNYYEAGLLELKNLLGLDPDSEVTLSGSMGCRAETPGKLEELYARALAARPEYRQASLQKKLAQEAVTLQEAGHYPYLGAYASRQYQGQTDRTFPGPAETTWSLAAGVKLNLPLFSGGSVTAKVRQAALELAIAGEELRDAGRQIRIAVKKAWLDRNEAAQRLASQATAVQTARKALAATELRFRNGLAGQLDLNDATLALNRAQILHTQALHDVCSASAQLEWAVGE